MRLGAIFIAVCIVVIAVSLSAAAHLTLGFSITESAAAALAVAGMLATVQVSTARSRERAVVERQIAELSRGTTDLAHRVGDLGRRVVTVEALMARSRDEARAVAAPLGTEIQYLGELLQQLAETLAIHDEVLVELRSAASRPPAAAPVVAPVAVAQPATVPATVPAAVPAEAPPVRAPQAPAAPIAAAPPPSIEHFLHAQLDPAADETAPDPDILAAIRDARTEIYLQTIVTLPQRKVRHYEATARLHTADGRLLAPDEYLAIASDAGLMPALDDLSLLRAAQVARRLGSRSRDAALFFSVGAATVAEGGFFTHFADFLAINPTLAPSLVLGIPQTAMTAMGPLEQEGMAQLARLGVRFCLDRVTDPQIEPRTLVGLGIRFVRAPASLLLNADAAANASIHPHDLSNLLGRFGIELIVDGIENETAVADLLDYDVRYGQGGLFGSPRPIRTDGLEAGAQPSADALNTAAAAAPPAERESLPPPPRRRESEQASQRPGERTPQALAQLARNLMRRA